MHTEANNIKQIHKQIKTHKAWVASLIDAKPSTKVNQGCGQDGQTAQSQCSAEYSVSPGRYVPTRCGWLSNGFVIG